MKECLDIMEWTKTERDHKGATTIVVICVMAVIMTLSMGLFLTASMLTRTSGRTLASEQCRILAVSFSEELERELCSSDFVYENQEQENVSKLSAVNGQSLWNYIRQNIADGSWPCYTDEGTGLYGEEDAVRSFTLKKTGVTGEIVDIVLQIYWIPETQKELSAQRIPKELVIQTKVEVKEQACMITDRYEIQVRELSDYDQWSISHVERK